MKKNYIVVKDNQLIQASYRLSLMEQRIILCCISKIDSTKKLTEDDGFTISVTDLQMMMTDNRNLSSLYDDVKSAVERLWNREIKLDEHGSALRWVVQKNMYQEDEGKVTLHFSSKIIPYLSQLKENFTQYRLEWVATFKSSHSIRIYELLMQHDWKKNGKREVELDWLKNILQVSDKYSRTNNFIQRVLTPCITEINNCSNLYVTYSVKKTGRKITHIQFDFKRKSKEVITKVDIKPKDNVNIKTEGKDRETLLKELLNARIRFGEAAVIPPEFEDELNEMMKLH
jgi:plasmid replication initiation protein